MSEIKLFVTHTPNRNTVRIEHPIRFCGTEGDHAQATQTAGQEKSNARAGGSGKSRLPPRPAGVGKQRRQIGRASCRERV